MTKPNATTHDIKDLIVRALRLTNMSPADIEDDAPLFVEGLGLDSVDALELVVAIETEYKLRIEDKAIGREAFQSASTLTTFINDRLSAQESEAAS